MGKNHLITGSAATVSAVSWLTTLGNENNYTVRNADGIVGVVAGQFGVDTADSLTNAGQAVSEWVLPWGSWTTPEGLLYLAVGVSLMLLGSVMPDMDNARSWMGRRLPGQVWRFVMRFNSPHRGWTHSIWSQILLFAVALPEPTRIALFFWFGWTVHLTMDMLGRAGRAWLYPFGRFYVATLPGGTRCVIQSGSKGLYRTGKRSETVVTWFVVLFYVLITSLIWVWR